MNLNKLLFTGFVIGWLTVAKLLSTIGRTSGYEITCVANYLFYQRGKINLCCLRLPRHLHRYPIHYHFSGLTPLSPNYEFR